MMTYAFLFVCDDSIYIYIFHALKYVGLDERIHFLEGCDEFLDFEALR